MPRPSRYFVHGCFSSYRSQLRSVFEMVSICLAFTCLILRYITWPTSTRLAPRPTLQSCAQRRSRFKTFPDEVIVASELICVRHCIRSPPPRPCMGINLRNDCLPLAAARQAFCMAWALYCSLHAPILTAVDFQVQPQTGSTCR